MPLSEYEQRVLEQMERQLTSDDPKLANTFHGTGTRGVRRWVLSGVGLVLGLAALVAGAALSQPIIGVLGFVAMFAAVVVAFSPPQRRGPTGTVRPDGTVRPPARRPSEGFMARFERRWDQRREGR